VEAREGETFTSISQGLRLSSMIISKSNEKIGRK
jgi:hypothetical protein